MPAPTSALRRPAEAKSRRPYSRWWTFAAPSFVILWFLGLGFTWWLIVPPIMFLAVIRRPAKRRQGAGLLFAIGAWLLVMAIITMAAGHTPSSRVAGAIFGALVWISAAMLVGAMGRAKPAEAYQFVRGLIFVGVAQGALTVLAVLAHPSPLSTFSLPSSRFLGGISSVDVWVTANLAYDAYFGQAVVRSGGIMGAAAWSGGFASLMLLLLILASKHLRAAGMSRAWWWIAVAANLATLYYSYVRFSIGLLVAILAAYALLWVCSRAPGGLMFAGVVIVAAVFFMFAFLPWQGFLEDQDSLRPGSSTTRFGSYLGGIQYATSQGPLVFLAGSGAKPPAADEMLAVGSESSWVGLLVRGGLVCVALLATFLVVRAVKAIRERDWVSLSLIFALTVRAVMEDIDLGTLTMVVAIVAVSSWRTTEPARSAGRA